MRSITAFCAAGLLLGAFTTNTLAEETPNIEFGMWETTSVMSMKSDAFSMPEQTTTDSSCVTKEKFEENQAFLENSEDCDIIERTVTSDAMNVSMVCQQEGMGEMKMDFNMQFEGDTMTGSVNGEVESPMGPMTMEVKMNGRRTGDC